jgi:TRAP transporter TAXI family solute receptor
MSDEARVVTVEQLAKSRRRALVGLSLLGLSVLVAGGLFARRRAAALRVATGVSDGTFHAMGLALQRTLARPEVDVRATVLVTGGSVENIAMLRSGAADIAFASSAVAPVEGASLLCPLGDELAHLVVRKGAGITRPSDLAGRAVSVGPERSGTRSAALSVLAHFGLENTGFRAVALSPGQALAAFARGEIDAAFILGPLRDHTVEALLARGDAELLSLGAPDEVGSALDGICANVPSLQRAVIPVFAYGAAPVRAVGTVRAQTYLLARDTLSPALAARVTEAVFRDKVGLSRVDSSLTRLSEQFDRGAVTYPIHVGADQYFRRDAPSFLERYCRTATPAAGPGTK